ncbi:hypothetical protein BDP81DRAFT_416735, partial [Colletotrichum phormii]
MLSVIAYLQFLRLYPIPVLFLVWFRKSNAKSVSVFRRLPCILFWRVGCSSM